MDVGINFHKNKKCKEHLEKLNLKWQYLYSKGYYIRFEATGVLDYDSMIPVCILIHFEFPNDAKLLKKF